MILSGGMLQVDWKLDLSQSIWNHFNIDNRNVLKKCICVDFKNCEES